MGKLTQTLNVKLNELALGYKTVQDRKLDKRIQALVLQELTSEAYKPSEALALEALRFMIETYEASGKGLQVRREDSMDIIDHAAWMASADSYRRLDKVEKTLIPEALGLAPALQKAIHDVYNGVMPARAVASAAKTPVWRGTLPPLSVNLPPAKSQAAKGSAGSSNGNNLAKRKPLLSTGKVNTGLLKELGIQGQDSTWVLSRDDVVRKAQLLLIQAATGTAGIKPTDIDNAIHICRAENASRPASGTRSR